MKKVLKTVLIIISSLIGILLILLIVLWINSPGKLKPLIDEQGNIIQNSISEKNKTEIGGIDQGFFIRSENPDNPVILFLHGGPGSPELAFLIPFETNERLEKYFTVCYWDQRGAGMTYSKSTNGASMNIDQFVEDTREMTEYLQKRFNKDKVYLMGHSWGSFLGIKTIEKYPENYIAYIGIGQVTNQKESEKIAYDYMLSHATNINDKKAVKSLEKFDRYAVDFPTNDYILSVRSQLMNKYGIGVIHENASMTKLVKEVLFFKGYTLCEKVKYPQGGMFSIDKLFQDILNDNLFESSNKFEIPVYITHGKYDYQVSYSLAKEYLDLIEAPDKKFFSFENSAHSPNMEEYNKFVSVIREINLISVKKFE